MRSAFLLLLLGPGAHWPAAESSAQGLQPFGTVTLPVAFDLNGQGHNVDSVAFFEAPDPADTLLFVTAKDNQLVEVWRHPFVGNELAPLTHPTFADSRANGVALHHPTDRLYVSVSAPSSTVSLFSVPQLGFLGEFVAGAVDLRGEPNLGLLEHASGQTRVYVTADSIVYIHDADSGALLGQFAPPHSVETVVGDDFHQAVYVPDEKDRTGVSAYDPDGAPFERGGTNRFGGGGIFESDAEGIVLYTCPSDGSTDTGSGWIVVADQKAAQTDFEFFDRESWTHLGALRLVGVSNTDGIGSTQRALPGHPLGLFVAIDDDTSAVGVGWDAILAATGLACPAATACANGLDDDGDGLADGGDPGCDDASDPSENGSPQCDDGVDNDGDGRTDFRIDPALHDPGCRTPTSQSEAPRCDDDADNDSDARVDWDGDPEGRGAGPAPADPECVGRPWRTTEARRSCGVGWELALLLPGIALRPRGRLA